MSVEPLPPNQEAGSKAPLQRVVQLFKRRRDVHFSGDDHAPKSILLTTIDGNLYQGEESLSDSIVNILDGIIQMGKQHRGGGVPEVLNPTDDDENLARHWQEDRRHFESFVEFVAVFREGMARLLAAQGLEKIAAILEELFDPKGTSGAVSRAVNAYSQRSQKARQRGRIRMEKTTGDRRDVLLSFAPAAVTGEYHPHARGSRRRYAEGYGHARPLKVGGDARASNPEPPAQDYCPPRLLECRGGWGDGLEPRAGSW